MSRINLFREASPTSKGLNLKDPLSIQDEEDEKSEDDKSIVSDAEHLIDYICAEEPNKGYGLRALRDLKKGIILGIMRGNKIKRKTLLEALLKTGIHTYIVQIDKNTWINPLNVNCNIRLVNHSCNDANCELVWITPKIVGLRLKRNVKRGEFFSFNYHLQYIVKVLKSQYIFKCKCTPHCNNNI